jgi:hypothetical protein
LKDQRKFGLFSLGATLKVDPHPAIAHYQSAIMLTTFRVQLLGLSFCFFADITNLRSWRVGGLGVWKGLAF